MLASNQAVIVSTARTAIGTAFKGSLVDVDALELGTRAVAEAVRRSGLEPDLIDDVVLGESLYGGGDIARYAAIEAGLVDVPGVAHNRHCASGLAAVQSAAASIRSGMDRAIVAGGAQSSSTSPRAKRRVPGTDDWDDWMSPSHRETLDAPQPRHVHHGGVECRGQGGRDPRADGCLGTALPPAGRRRDRRRQLPGGDLPARGDAPGRQTSTFAVDEHPRRETTMESSPV